MYHVTLFVRAIYLMKFKITLSLSFTECTFDSIFVKSRPISTIFAQMRLENNFFKRGMRWLTYYISKVLIMMPLFVLTTFAVNRTIHVVYQQGIFCRPVLTLKADILNVAYD